LNASSPAPRCTSFLTLAVALSAKTRFRGPLVAQTSIRRLAQPCGAAVRCGLKTPANEARAHVCGVRTHVPSGSVTHRFALTRGETAKPSSRSQFRGADCHRVRDRGGAERRTRWRPHGAGCSASSRGPPALPTALPGVSRPSRIPTDWRCRNRHHLDHISHDLRATSTSARFR
jgi:hypothetical protein